MNISHLYENDSHINEELSFEITMNTINKPRNKTSKATLISEILILVDETTPNYVLGYN
jgi:hypothetical protein